MKLIAITKPDFYPDEAGEIANLLERGWQRVHLRKPTSTAEETERLLAGIPERYYKRLSLHDHFHLALKYGLGGLHLNSRNPEAPADWKGLTSRSCHTLAELQNYNHLDYLTLSPIFGSISKPGYTREFLEEELMATSLEKVYALGGVTFNHLPLLEQMGFGGAAMLSGAWDLRYNMLQLITHTTDGLEEALRGGCRWVQIRMKDASDEDFSKTAARAIRMCRSYGATAILDDRVHLAESLGADGVHLGKNDMPLREARKLLGKHKIIGATANTIADIAAAAEAGADYIGLGPLRFTTTKKGLSPLIGLEGYRKIIKEVRSMGITIPIVAIGGIRRDDILALRDAGLDGVAISGLILTSDDKRETTEEILKLWKN